MSVTGIPSVVQRGVVKSSARIPTVTRQEKRNKMDIMIHEHLNTYVEVNK